MGVRFAREYKDIIRDLAVAIEEVPNFYAFFEMEERDWIQLDEANQQECIQTLADDLFYGLGTNSLLHVGQGAIAYDKENHVLKVSSGDNLVRIVYLV